MNTTTKLLLSGKDNIILNTQLAVEIGLNEAIVLRQVYYWVEHYEAEKKNFRDGKYWVYNSMKQWRSDNFPFMSEKTIERAFKSLKEKKLILVGDYSSDRMKRPNWYTVNDEKFEELIKKIAKAEYKKEEKEEHSEEKETECLNGVRQNDGMQSDTPTDCYNIYNNINNTDTETTNRDYNTDTTDMYAFSDKSSKVDMYASVSEKQEAEQKPTKKSRYIPKDYTEEQLREHIKPVIDNYIDNNCDKLNKDELKDNLLEIISEFYREYEKKFGEKHRILADVSYENIAERYLKPPSIMNGNYDTDAYSAMIEQYFIVEFNKRKKYNKPIEISLSHFMSDEIRGHLYWQTCV